MRSSAPIADRFLISTILALLLAAFLLISLCEQASAANRLAGEKSPYLLKHAENPVDWYPWSEEAFTAAKDQDKPILLSVGYSTCHWCNVMEEESFSDPEVATLLNEVFITIKVDREERPDIDRMAMDACQLLTKNCGWPLNIFMTPDKKPFYAGAYFPKESRFGLSGLTDLSKRIRDMWKNDRAALVESATMITIDLARSGRPAGSAPLDIPLFAEKGYDQLAQRYDREYGGFGQESKFARPASLFFLLRHFQRTGNKKALEIVEKTLGAMTRGALFDQLGGGFHRYTADRQWRTPHFEKMLYDQALLLSVYTEAYQLTGKKEYATVARAISSYVLAEMTQAQGAFISAESADSEKEEGRFYLWSAAEMRAALGEDAAAAMKYYQATELGNYSTPETGVQTGKNTLYPEDAPAPANIGIIRSKLLAARLKRIRPFKDDKVLTDWNGLMIGALAKAGRVLSEPSYTRAAERAADFILTHLSDKNGRLLHRWRDNEAGINAGNADYASLVWGMIELYGATFDTRYLTQAIRLNDVALEIFWHPTKNVFLSFRNEKDPLLASGWETEDLILPSDNGIALLNLLRLGRITGNTTLEERANQLAEAVAGAVKQTPAATSMLLTAMDFARGPTQEIVVVGKKDSLDTKKMLEALNRRFLPNAVVVFKDPEQSDPELIKLAPYTAYMSAIKNRATIYVCSDYQCQFPTNDLKKMDELLDAALKPPPGKTEK